MFDPCYSRLVVLLMVEESVAVEMALIPYERKESYARLGQEE